MRRSVVLKRKIHELCLLKPLKKLKTIERTDNRLRCSSLVDYGLRANFCKGTRQIKT